jgi:FixJ family two-component response regulator
LATAASHTGAIHLLLTDVVMPGLSGRQVAEQLTGVRPEIRVLFMSGYTDNVIAQRGVLEAGTAFLSKPFTPDALADKVRGVLD